MDCFGDTAGIGETVGGIDLKIMVSAGGHWLGAVPTANAPDTCAPYAPWTLLIGGRARGPGTRPIALPS